MIQNGVGFFSVILHRYSDFIGIQPASLFLFAGIALSLQNAVIRIALLNVLPHRNLLGIALQIDGQAVAVHRHQPPIPVHQQKLSVRCLAEGGKQAVVSGQVIRFQLLHDGLQSVLNPVHRHIHIISLHNENLDHPHQSDGKDHQNHHDEPEPHSHPGIERNFFFI